MHEGNRPDPGVPLSGREEGSSAAVTAEAVKELSGEAWGTGALQVVRPPP